MCRSFSSSIISKLTSQDLRELQVHLTYLIRGLKLLVFQPMLHNPFLSFTLMTLKCFSEMMNKIIWTNSLTIFFKYKLIVKMKSLLQTWNSNLFMRRLINCFSHPKPPPLKLN
uniref:Uncharacterized protein n=1 Tax=Lactuca sativa TaxID=4236 RepID=A0A9R1UDL9_LACSA|nr:hypothetical protein LSAT_V11C900486180 [Lactuca sativa]